MSIQPTNQKIISERWPELWQTLTQQEYDVNAVELVTTMPEQTLFIHGIHLTSTVNRPQEALLQSQHIAQNSQVATVYGFALGDLARVLLKRKKLTQCRIVILSTETTYWSLTYFDHSDWLSDPRVELQLADAHTQLQKPFALAPACCRLADDTATKLKDLIKIEINRPLLEHYFKKTRQQWKKQLLQNKALLAEDKNVNLLFNTITNKKVVVIAGGPSANAQFDWIKQQRDDLIIIATTTTLKPLQQQQIFPDLAIIIDHKADAIQHIESLNLANYQNIPLVYLPVVHHTVLQQWRGPRLVSLQKSSLFSEIKKQYHFAELHNSGTVTHSAIDLAVKMGAKQIILVGTDFCYIDKQSHLQGATSPINIATANDYGHAWVITGEKKRALSDENLVMYLRELEKYIAVHPQIEFINTGKQGAQIEGCRWLEEQYV